ncbi:DUF4290 domain-containing protein [Phaeodactylibacter luteus]|nr:DUF4290 domain-containing protein [Phaeodactylibacter luteus]
MNDPVHIGMEYNSNRENLIIPEYGRNVQKMIAYAKELESREMRQAVIEKIIDMMQMMHPQSRSIEDYRERLWKHVFRIADYDLDVDYPYGDPPTEDEKRKKPDQVPYPVMEARYRHYGHNVQVLIKKAREMEEGPKREGFVSTIGSYMKLAYRTWNKEHYVSDEVIKGDLESLSGGELSMSENESIENLTNNNTQGGSHHHSNNNNNNRRRATGKRGSSNNSRQRGGGRGSYRRKR